MSEFGSPVVGDGWAYIVEDGYPSSTKSPVCRSVTAETRSRIDSLAAVSRQLGSGSVVIARHALVNPALSFCRTWLTVKLAGVCDGGNSINDWTICAT